MSWHYCSVNCLSNQLTPNRNAADTAMPSKGYFCPRNNAVTPPPTSAASAPEGLRPNLPRKNPAITGNSRPLVKTVYAISRVLMMLGKETANAKAESPMINTKSLEMTINFDSLEFGLAFL